jgi:thiosulfate/3-mercaptopyruvate sulfurtransferase
VPALVPVFFQPKRFCLVQSPRSGRKIPGALNYPFNLNFDSNGQFKPAQNLGAGLQALMDGHGSKQLVNMCGSGVMACHNAFAAKLAGLDDPRLYVGSWSEWIQDPGRPVKP